MDLVKGGLCGILIAIVINVSIIFHFFFDMTNFSIFSFAFISGIITLILIFNNYYKKIIISSIIAVLSLVLVSFLIDASGVNLYFFQRRYEADQLPWAGDGFGMMVSFIFCLFGSGIGVLVAFAIVIIKRIVRRIKE